MIDCCLMPSDQFTFISWDDDVHIVLARLTHFFLIVYSIAH
jgi:hypothetical protein